MAERITVTSPAGVYDILIEHDLLQRIGRDAANFGLDGNVVVVTNEIVAPLYGEALVQSLPKATLITIPDGEAYKTLETVTRLYDTFIDAGLDRSGTVIALGGGVLGDTAGFAAASYMRGVRLVQIPTTVLAMVDSSVGGKVGVDLPQGKNLVGAFKQPAMVLIDPEVLQTLPPRQWRCGMAEIIKHGLLANEGLLDPARHTVENNVDLLQRAIQVKVDVVQADPFELGVRAHLNLGHTFGHAIEQVTHYEWLHGEAVAVGLVAAARLSHHLELCDESLICVVEDVLTTVGLPTTTNDLNPSDIYAAMSTDKKWKNGHSHFVLLRGIGQPTIVRDVPREAIIAALSQGRLQS